MALRVDAGRHTRIRKALTQWDIPHNTSHHKTKPDSSLPSMVYGINHYSIPYSNQISFCLKMKLVLFSIIPFISITQSSAQRGGHNSGRVCDDKSSAMLACYQDLASKDSCVKCYTSESWSCGSISSSVLDINQKCVNAGKCASDCSAYGKAFLQCLMEYQCG